MGKRLLGGLLERMDYREQCDYYSTRMWSVLHRNLIISETRLPKNCLSRIWLKLTVKNERLFLGLHDNLCKNYAGTLTFIMLITCIIIKSYALALNYFCYLFMMLVFSL